MVYQETMHSQAMPVRDVNYANEKAQVEQMINKLSSHPSVVRYGWGNEYYGCVLRTAMRIAAEHCARCSG